MQCKHVAVPLRMRSEINVLLTNSAEELEATKAEI